MSRFEGNDKDQKIRLIKEELSQPMFANVLRVKERHPEVEDRYEQGDASRSDVVNDYSNRQYEVDVSAQNLFEKRSERHYDVPVIVGTNGLAAPPEPGDLVVIDFLGEGEQPFVVGKRYNADEDPPVARRGTYRLQKGQTKLELYEERDRPEQEDLEEYIKLAIEDKETQGFEDVEILIREKEPNSGEYVVEIGGDETDPFFKMDFEDGSFKIKDGANYGISSDGEGNFEWKYNNIDFIEQ